MYFPHSGARIRVFEQNRKQIAAEIIQNSGKILLFSMINKSWPIQCLCFVANVSDVSH